MSSPLRPRGFDPISISSSSPCLPPLDEIFCKNPRSSRLRTRNHATPIPADARTTFTSAAVVLRDAPEIDIDTEAITSSPPCRNGKTFKGRRRKASTSGTVSKDQGSHQSVTVIGSLSPNDKPWQKFRSTRSMQDGERPSSPTQSKTSTSTAQLAKTKGTVSRHFNMTKADSPFEDNTKEEKFEADIEPLASGVHADTASESAVPRRGEWTPPKANGPVVFDSDSDARELFSSVEKVPASKGVFKTLHSQYGRQSSDSTPEPCQQPQVEILKKRKRIEMVCTGQEEIKEQGPHEEVPSNVPQRSEPKAPAPKKKTRTITELATAPFAAPPTPNFDLAGPATKESMLDYFDSDGAVKALVEHQSAVMSQRKPKTKDIKQPLKTKRKKKAGTQANPILLSPSSALKQSSNQDFIFGTSSQLVQEESPTTLRYVQDAIRASNTLNSDPFDDGVSQRLWHAGARDDDGELIGLEVVDLQHGPATITERNSTATPAGQSFVDIDDILSPPDLAENVPSEPKRVNSHFFPSQSTKQTPGSAASESGRPVNAPNVGPRPNYELFTDAQLSRKITSYGFKPVKKRVAMIALLDHCWASKNEGMLASSTQRLSVSTLIPAPAQQKPVSDAPNKAAVKPRGGGRPKKSDDTAMPVAKPAPSNVPSPKRSRIASRKNDTSSTSTSNPVSLTSTPSPKRSRGRPRKSSTTSIEIPDSENETLSSVSSPEPVFSSPPPLDLTTSDEGDMSLTLSPTNQQAELFKHITMAVTSAPRSQDPSNPSWYEKMLLYDPIILEELASWLNGGELTRTGYDGEVSPFDVKKWCESKSVICLWRQNMNGKERKRY
ncbi:hypothetical protein NUW58_g822 [Xylaria curta]|uniref:Uncharacterized protein n=1 Tax=Xylaria curta TaxID=42375 RepID=A0ACC1PMR9_9PEZI|nr:hypothetical protein NUW58_g822 [Xylaria curta]